jgi:recombination protein RecT
MSNITTPNQKQMAVPSYPTLIRMEKFLEGAVPSEMCAKRLIRLFFVELSKNTDLNKCTTDSICGAIMSCAQLGLEPGIAGMLYLIPRGGKMTIQLGYRGMIELCHRSGKVSTIKSYSVFENDQFSVDQGSEDKIIHKRGMGNRGRMIGVYAIVTMKDGSQHFDVMDMDELKELRVRSGSMNSPAWRTDYQQMAQKTVIKRVLKYAPTSTTLSSAISLDEANNYDGQDLEAVGRVALIEAGIGVDTETGEVKSQPNEPQESPTETPS